MQLERGVSGLDRSKEILVPGNRQVWVVPALEEKLIAADGDRLFDLAQDLFKAKNVPFGRTHRAVERAEVAPRDADVRIVDVAIDDVGDDAVRMLTGTDPVGQEPEHMCRRVPIKIERFGGAHAPPCSYLPGKRIDHRSSRRVRCAAPGLHARSTAPHPGYIRRAGPRSGPA